MKKIDELVKRVEFFERLAVYGDRKSFLKRIAQDASYEGFKGSTMVGDSGEPPASPTQTLKETVISVPKRIDPNVQSMLNDLLVPSGHIMPLKMDGELGDFTREALKQFKNVYHEPATVAAITKVHQAASNPSAVAKNPGAPLPPGKSNFPSGNTKATGNSSAGNETKVPGPKV